MAKKSAAGNAENKRESVSVKTRFEVFKRDNFTCRYCSRKTPEVVLVIDHVIPVCQGGGSDIDNLVTACWECNAGKGGNALSEAAPVNDPSIQAILMLERERQLREYNHIRQIVRAREDAEIDQLLEFWDSLASGRARAFPPRGILRHFLKRIPVQDILDAMEIAYELKGDYHGCRYLSGILKNKIGDMEGGD